MAKCARCGAENAKPPSLNRNGEYMYCEDCQEIFQEAKENGVHVRSRHTNREFDRYPYEVVTNADGIDNPQKEASSDNWPKNQIEALAMAKSVMDEHEIPGVFVYQKTGSVWLIDEYLDVHPAIAKDVEEELNSWEESWLSRILGG